MRRKFLSGDWIETRSFWKSMHFCETKAWKAWKPRGASAAEVTRIPPVSQ